MFGGAQASVKMHTLIDMRGSIPEFIPITDRKYHDGNALDVINFYAGAIYLTDKVDFDFEALFRISNAGAFFVTRAKDTMWYDVVEQNFNIDGTTGLRTGRTAVPTVSKSKKLYPKNLRQVEFYDAVNGGVAICTHLTVACIRHLTKSPLSIYEIMQVSNVSPFDRTPVRDLLNAHNLLHIKQNQNIKEPLLF